MGAWNSQTREILVYGEVGPWIYKHKERWNHRNMGANVESWKYGHTLSYGHRNMGAMKGETTEIGVYRKVAPWKYRCMERWDHGNMGTWKGGTREM